MVYEARVVTTKCIMHAAFLLTVSNIIVRLVTTAPTCTIPIKPTPSQDRRTVTSKTMSNSTMIASPYRHLLQHRHGDVTPRDACFLV